VQPSLLDLDQVHEESRVEAARIETDCTKTGYELVIGKLIRIHAPSITR
jgi:hypothetical protein